MSRQRILGIDFDNTLACYDQLFDAVARESGLLEPGVGQLTKQEVKRELLERDQESEWTRLQGLVYGPEMHRAAVFEGALNTLRTLRKREWSLVIVSHKTRYPVIGAPHDLHEAALAWLSARGFAELELVSEGVFFEPTRARKIERLRQLRCEAFIDDLPEVLAEPEFPSIQRFLLDPHGGHRSHPLSSSWRSLQHWDELLSWLC